MRWITGIATAAFMTGLSPQAHAADWWLVAGDPGGNAVIFIDADTVVKSDDAITFQMQRIQRDGRATKAVQQLNCKASPASSEEGEAMRRFACATEKERMNFALIVGPMTTLETARLIFAMPGRSTGNKDELHVAGK